MKAKRVRMEVLPSGLRDRDRRWAVLHPGKSRFYRRRKVDAIAVARELIGFILEGGRTVTLKIKGLSGAIQDERTYPRSSDPRKTKG